MTQHVSESEAQRRDAEEVMPPPARSARPDSEASGTRVSATETEARELAEAAREPEWNRPSFAKGIYLGRFDLSLVHPHPRGANDDVERGEDFLAKLHAVCETLDGQRVEQEDRIPD